MMPQETILAVGEHGLDTVAPLLEQSPFKVERVRDGLTAVLLARKMRFQHLVVGFPLPDLSISEFAEKLRLPDSASPTARLLLITTDEHLAEAASYRDEGLIAGAVSIDLDAEELVDAIVSFMKTAPRVSAVLPIQLRAPAGEYEILDGETVNVSETGLLVRCLATLPRGAKVDLELLPARGKQPIRGSAVVVRQAHAEVEGLRGLGFRFVAFQDDGQARLAVLIRAILAEFVG
jgi:hypothetical protein